MKDQIRSGTTIGAWNRSARSLNREGEETACEGAPRTSVSLVVTAGFTIGATKALLRRSTVLSQMPFALIAGDGLHAAVTP